MKSPDQPPGSRQRALFLKALERPTPAERHAFLDGACADDFALRAAVEALLEHHEEDSFLEESPAAGAFAVAEPETLPVHSLADAVLGDRIGRYKVLQKIGEGGMGVVYMAEQEEPVRRRVALKIIKLGMDTKSVIARFEAERQALALMDHPNIAKVLDGGATEAGRPYFVMELVRGIKITEYCDEAKVPTRDRLDLFIKVCQAIQHAHQKGIIHRDIKPSNILVTINDGVAVPKVIDFGIAKATEGRLTAETLFTQFESFMGTPAYVSPEQAVMTSLDIDTRSDIYSLGVLLYELLAGRTPFDAKELMASGLDAMRRTIREQEPVRPSTKLSQTLVAANAKRITPSQSQIDPDLDWIVMKCLEKDRTRRYETANGLAADLKRHLSNEPVVARPPSTAYRLQKLLRRNKLAFIATAAVAIAMVLGVAVSAWHAVRARFAERHAQTEAARALEAERVAREESAVAEEQRWKAARSAEALRYNLYASEMSAAFGAFWAGSVRRSRDLLERQSQADRAGNRGFEWRWLWGQTSPAEQSVLPITTDQTAVIAVDFSVDGKRLLTFDQNNLKVWDAGTHKLVRANRHDFGYHAEFSPDGKFIVSVETSGSRVRLWDATTGILVTNFVGHIKPVLYATLSPDGRQLVSVGSSFYSHVDGEIFLWDVASGQRTAVLRSAGSEFMFCAKFSPDGQTLAVVCGSGHILLWDVPTQSIIGRLTGHKGAAMGVGFTPDGKRLVSVGLDRTVRLWDVNECKGISLLGLHEKRVWGVSVSPDGRLAATTGFDHMVKVWSLDRPGLLRTFRGHEARATGVAFHPDGTTLVTADGEGIARFWKVPSGPDDWNLDGEYGYSFGLASKSRLLLGLLTGGHINIWDVTARKQLIHVPGENAVWVPNTEQTVFHRGLQLIELDVPSKSEQVLGAACESEKGLTGMRCSSDGRLLAWGHGDHTHVFNRESRVEVTRLNTGERGAEQIAFSPDGSTLATGGSGSSFIQLWDTATWQMTKTLQGHRQGIRTVTFSPDGQELASSSADQTTRLWRLSTGEQVILRDDEGVPTSMAFSPEGRTLAVGTFEGSVKLWNVITRQQIASLEAGASIVYSVNFSPDGLALSSITLDGKVRVWQAPSWGEIQASEGRENTESKHP